MGKASKWFRGLLGLKKSQPNTQTQNSLPPPNTPKKKWTFSKSNKDRYTNSNNNNNNNYHPPQHVTVDQVNRQAIEFATATVAAAHAAVKQSSIKKKFAGHERRQWAAVTIQSHYRGHLSRKALRALRALVKLQARVRGHLMRKRTADALRQLQAVVNAQTRARVSRGNLSESPHSSIKSSHFSYHGPETPEKSEHVIQPRSAYSEQSMLKRNGSRSNLNHTRIDGKMAEKFGDERNDKILEIDSGKPHVTPRRRSLFQSSSHLSINSDQNCHSVSTSKDSTARQPAMSPSYAEVQSVRALHFAADVDETVFCTADNSPQFYSAASSRKDAYTPTKSDGSRSCLSGYSDSHPSYMAYTESSKAKVRSLSAPKQRPQYYERSSSTTKRYSIHGGYGDSRPQRVSAVQANFATKAYPGSGRLDRLGMPVQDVTSFSGGPWVKYQLNY